ncbi:MAG: hypothetical protein RI580_06490 [Halothece sp. Uz-M2-17]|nr:hypothetical protein [Halothece sp. Uz-M2-17]
MSLQGNWLVNVSVMVTQSKLEKLTKKIAMARQSLDELAFQERDLLEQLEDFQCELLREGSYWHMDLGFGFHGYFVENFDQDQASNS